MRLTLFLLAVVGCVLFANVQLGSAHQEIPQKFLAAWEVDKSENFDEYLEAKGYGWFMRQMVKLASIKKTFSRKGGDLYHCKIETTKKNVAWDFKLGEEFQGEYLDDSQHKITFSFDSSSDKLIERHVKVDASAGEEPDVYEYNIDEQGYLVMHMVFNGVSTNRFYKKVA